MTILESVEPDGESRRFRIRVLVADHQPLIIAGFRRAVERFEEIEVAGEAHNAHELIQLIERRAPDVVLMENGMPGLVGVELIEHICERWPELKVVVLSGCDDGALIDRTFRAGAAAYILKSAATADVISVLRQVFSGAVFHAPANPPLCCATPEHPEHPALSDRERTVLGAVAAGLTTAAIGRQLWISDHTVKFHLTNIYRKLGVRNRAGAVRYAIEHDLAQA